MNRRFVLLLSTVVAVGLGIGAFAASKTTSSGPVVQSLASFQGRSGSGQGGFNRQGANGATGNSSASNQANGGKSSQGPRKGSRGVFGSVASRDGNTLTVNTQQGSTKVNLSGAKLQKTVDGTTSDLKSGETVLVMGQQGQDGVVTASSIQIRASGSTTPQGMAGGQRRGQNQGQSHRNRPVVGTISSVSGDTTTVSTQQGDVKVKLTGAKIEKTVDATADDLKAGERVMVTGEQDKDGSYTANAVEILPSGSSSTPRSGTQSAQSAAVTP